MLLYKYLPPGRVDVLRDRSIRFTQPLDLNDPFECRPRLTVSGAMEMHAGIIGAVHNAVGGAPATPASTAAAPDAMVSMLSAVLGGTVGILSLSERWDDLVMWAHYADRHGGFVIGFNGEDPWFGGTSGTPQIGPLSHVSYRETRPSVPLDEAGVLDFYFTKGTDWSHEQEWRVARNLGDVEGPDGKGRFPIVLYSFPASAVKRVIVGARADDQLRGDLAQVLLHADFSSVRIEIAELDPSRYGLVLRVVTSREIAQWRITAEPKPTVSLASLGL